jgi:GNAT superfamily N-acetyltransferase
MLTICHDTQVPLDFCRREPIRFRQILHRLDPPCPAWDAAMKQHGQSPEDAGRAKNTEEPPPILYVDSLVEPSVLVCIDGSAMRAEGDASKVTAEELRRLRHGNAPKDLTTTDAALRDRMRDAFEQHDWTHSKQYTTTAEEFEPRASSRVQTLSADDRVLWKRFTARHPDEGLVAARGDAGGPGTRDFEFMCAGLPVDYYAAIVDDGIAGFVSVNPMTRECDEISALFVDPAHRRKGIAHSLLTAATKDILSRGRQPGYFAGSAGDDLDRMLKGLGYHLVSEVWWHCT